MPNNRRLSLVSADSQGKSKLAHMANLCRRRPMDRGSILGPLRLPFLGQLMTFQVPNQYRVKSGRMASDDSMPDCGAFFVPNKLARSGPPLRVIAAAGDGWEHVSVSLPNRCPSWEEMAYIKGLFWSDDMCVMQLHPPRSEHINNHPYCLHLWRPLEREIPRPPGWMVGV